MSLATVENDRTRSVVPALDSPMETQCGSALLRSGLKVEPGCDFDPALLEVTESISQLFYVIAFSHLSCPRHVLPSIALNSVSPKIQHTLYPVQNSAPYADDSSGEPPDSLRFTEPVSAVFVRPASPLPPSSPGFTHDYSMECSDDLSIPQFPLLSSPVPSSSPPNFFTSSPTRHAPWRSPLTSPVSVEKPTTALQTVGSNPLKRPRSPGTTAASLGDQDDSLEGETTKKMVRCTRCVRACGAHCL